MKQQTAKWIEAAKILMVDPSQKIQCPECKTGNLIVKDETIHSREKTIDRYLICDHCGKWNVITMADPNKASE